MPYRADDALAAFSGLWKTGFLDNLWIEVIDEPYENGVTGKHVVFHLEERLRVKGLEFVGAREVEPSRIETELKNRRFGIGGLVPEEASLLRRVRAVVMDLYAQQGYPNATVEVRKLPIPGGLKLAQLVFDIKAGARSRF
jgi:outer membrane protein assembly factor BamA